jgi:hypothetical protein
MNTKTLKVKPMAAFTLALLMIIPMLLAATTIVKASGNSTPVLSVVLSGTTGTTLIPAQSAGSTFNVDIRVDNTSSVSPGINSYSYALTWNPAVLNVTNVNDAFSGSFLNSGANLGTVESLGDLPANDTKGQLIIGDIILNTSDFAACATGSGVLTTVTFRVLTTGRSNINLQPSDVGVAYLTYPDSQGNSHDVVATTTNAVYVSLTPSSNEVGITGYKLIFNTTLTNMFASAQSINYSWSYVVYKYNATAGTYSTAVGGVPSPTPTTPASVPIGTSTVQSGSILLSGVGWGDWIEVIVSFDYSLGGNVYSIGYVTKLNVHPGDISGGTIAFPYLGAKGAANAKDLGLLATYWLESVPSGTNPTSDLARADIGGYGVVNAKDLGILATNWLLGWTNTPP